MTIKMNEKLEISFVGIQQSRFEVLEMVHQATQRGFNKAFPGEYPVEIQRQCLLWFGSIVFDKPSFRTVTLSQSPALSEQSGAFCDIMSTL
jgi:hypothetical protein